MINFFSKLISGIFIGLAIALVFRNGCTVKTVKTSNTEASPSPSPVEVTTPDCLTSLSKIVTQKDEDKSSKDVETEADALEVEGRGQESLNKYSEAYLLHMREKGYAAGRAMRGDPSATLEINTSIESPEFLFKAGRAFTKTGKHETAISCFSESLSNKIASPNDANAYLNRGETYLALGQKEKARQDYQKASELFQQYKLPQYQKMATEKLRSITP